MKKYITAIITIAALSGCATTVVPQPTGGSRADGTITMSYQYGAFEKPQYDQVTTDQKASERCAAWGYTSAQAFGGTITNCAQPDGWGGCNSWQVDMQYQCIE